MTARLTARLTTSAGRPIDHAVVTVMSTAGQQQQILHPDADGQVLAEELSAGTYTLVASAAGYQPAARTAVVPDAGPLGLGDVTLARIGGAPSPRSGSWEIDTTHSTVEVSVRHLGIATVRGRFTQFSGTIEVGDDPAESVVTAEIQTSSIDTGNSMRDGILRSADFFDVERFPTAVFRADRVRPSSDDRWSLDGTLTLRDSEVPVTLDLAFLGQTDDPWGSVRAGFHATCTLRRKDFGIDFDDRLVSGVAQIGNKAELVLDIQAVRAAD